MEAAMKQLFFDFLTHEEVNKNFLELKDMSDKSQIKIWMYSFCDMNLKILSTIILLNNLLHKFYNRSNSKRTVFYPLRYSLDDFCCSHIKQYCFKFISRKHLCYILV